MLGINRSNASFLISAIGVMNMTGKICLGYLCDKPLINRTFVYGLTMAICGISEKIAYQIGYPASSIL